MVYDKVFDMNLTKFKHNAILTQRVKVSDPAKPIEGYLTFITCNDVTCMPPNESFSEDTLSIGNAAFGALVRAALWRASHGWCRDAHVVWEVPLVVAHQIAPESVWAEMKSVGIVVARPNGYGLCVDWGIRDEQQNVWRPRDPEEGDGQ